MITSEYILNLVLHPQNVLPQFMLPKDPQWWHQDTTSPSKFKRTLATFHKAQMHMTPNVHTWHKDDCLKLARRKFWWNNIGSSDDTMNQSIPSLKPWLVKSSLCNASKERTLTVISSSTPHLCPFFNYLEKTFKVFELRKSKLSLISLSAHSQRQVWILLLQSRKTL